MVSRQNVISEVFWGDILATDLASENDFRIDDHRPHVQRVDEVVLELVGTFERPLADVALEHLSVGMRKLVEDFNLCLCIDLRLMISKMEIMEQV